MTISNNPTINSDLFQPKWLDKYEKIKIEYFTGVLLHKFHILYTKSHGKYSILIYS